MNCSFVRQSVGSDFMLTSKMKPGGMWNSPVSQEYPMNSGALSLDASPLETGERFVTGVSPNRRHVDEPYRTAAANHTLPSASDLRQNIHKYVRFVHEGMDRFAVFPPLHLK